MRFSVSRGFFGLAALSVAAQGFWIGGLTKMCAPSLDLGHGFTTALTYELTVIYLSILFAAGIPLLVLAAIPLLLFAVIPIQLTPRVTAFIGLIAGITCIAGYGLALTAVPFGSPTHCQVIG